MTLPTIYEDAISCFCPRTAKMMRRCIMRYILTHRMPRGITHYGKSISAILKIIYANFDLAEITQNCNNLAPLGQNCNNLALLGQNCNNLALSEKCNNLEEEQKEKLSDEKNKTLLPPTPPINKTIKAENGKENKEEMCVINACAREKFLLMLKIQILLV